MRTMSLVTEPTHTATLSADVLLSDGSIAAIRPMRHDDREGLLALHEDLGDRSVLMRFFTVNRLAGRRYVEHLVQGTGDTVITLVVAQDHEIVAAATAERTAPHSAEIAVLVADRLHGKGLGSLLLEHLAAACRDRGIHRLTAEVLAQNDDMLRVLRDAGFGVELRRDGDTVRIDLLTSPTSTLLQAADAREFGAESQSLRPLLYPSSVAVVGVRRDGQGIGTAVLQAIVQGGFTGRLHVVHPSAEAILGIRCDESFADIADEVDLAVIAVPAPHVLAVLEDAAAQGVRAAVVVSSGFGELGAAGEVMQREIVRVARDHSIRLVGPNCLGVLDNDPAIRLNGTFAADVPPHGGLAVATQSGGVGIAMLDIARDLHLGVHTLISLGNKVDVSGNDLLAAWYDDPQVSAVALYLESFGNAPKFARIARRFSERKPILAMVGGRSSGGARAGASHTAAAAAPSLGVEALFAQAGVIGCRRIESMVLTALVLEQQPLPRGRRIGIVTNAGGIGVLAADCAEDHALVVPAFSRALEDEMKSLVDSTSGTANPIDLGAGAAGDLLEGVLRRILDSREVDMLVIPLVATSVTDGRALARAVGRARADHPDVPVLVVAMGGLDAPPELLDGVTVARTPEDAIESLALTTRYADWRRTPDGEQVEVDDARSTRARSNARALLLGDPSSTGTWLDADHANTLLGEYGIRTIGAVASNPDDAAAMAAAIGFPVAIKVIDPTVVHKTERGLVATGVSTQRDVRTVVRRMARELGQPTVPVLVQPTVHGVELALGITRDPGFGPLVMVAAGGVAEAVWADRTFLLPPISRRDAARALRSLRIWPLLDGYRGAPPVDVAHIEDLLCSLGRLAREVPEVAELDLNPVIATGRGAALVDVKVRLTPSSMSDDFRPRQLRAATPARS